ncbi:helix-turn-helix domain-containing protein [Caenimonas aquaedulcis]|uniref:DUF4115 domain-containing protein n=1 Tax=Caenimonas aquaedulcis TaxID=2793270 RepID=A0A931H1F6_9BURK|nr:helix-turn-helix domain-containing protein [Caenimonas aquaedulcis]MBG9386816.1 DUF4115 domain-containing protein [Caenimonas aquaedulcis]
MSESWAQEGQDVQAPPAAADSVTAGALLRQAREAAGLHVAALAVALKVPVRKLEALEDNRWDVLTDSVFVRALASSVCRNLKVDPQPILDRLPRTPAPRLMQASEGINAPFRAPSDAAPPSWYDQVTKPVFLVVFAILLGAIVIILLPARHEAPPVALMPTEAQPVLVPPPNPAPTMDIPAAAASTPVAAAAPPVAPAPAVSSAAPPVAAPSAASSGATASASASAPAAPAAPASGIVVVRTKGQSWVEVTDARGAMVLRRQMESGEAAGVSGALPLRVTIGRVDNTEVQVRGKSFDLRPVSRDNVARFEVK